MPKYAAINIPSDPSETASYRVDSNAQGYDGVSFWIPPDALTFKVRKDTFEQMLCGVAGPANDLFTPMSETQSHAMGQKSALQNTFKTYINPTEPVGLDDWEALDDHP